MEHEMVDDGSRNGIVVAKVPPVRTIKLCLNFSVWLLETTYDLVCYDHRFF